MVNIIGVRFKKVGKVYHFSPGGLEINKGDTVIVETSRGIEIGEVVVAEHEIDEKNVKKPLRSVIRIANDDDMKILEKKRRRSRSAAKK